MGWFLYDNGLRHYKVKLWFGQISLPLISLYYFPLLQNFDLKMSSSLFKNLHKFLQLIPAI